jgi:hypothetical protein
LTREVLAPATPRRRRSLRVHIDVSLSVTIVGKRRETGVIREISLGGAFLETNQDLKVGDSLRLEITAGTRRFQSSAIVRNTKEGGAGVEFVRMTDEDRKILRAIMTGLLQ